MNSNGGVQKYIEMDKTVIIDSKDTVPIKRRLGFCGGVALIVGTIIGSGIFVSPKGILANTGSVGASLLVWGLCGFISMLAALVFAELGLLIPKSGGDFTYLLAVFGRFPAFMYLWSQLLTGPSGMIILGLTLAEYMSKAIFDDCGPTLIFKQVVAATVILTSGVSNCISVRIGEGTQLLFTSIKFLGLTVIVIGGFVMLAKGNNKELSTGFDDTIEDPFIWVTAFYSGMWAYGGWSNLNFIIEEVQNPKRNLPLCIITSMVLVTILYLLVNVSYLAVLTKTEFLSSWATGVTWAEYVIPPAVILIPIVVACSVYGTMNGSSFVIPRIFFAGAREGLFPEFLSYLNVHNNVPIPAISTMLSVSFVMMIPADLSKMLNLVGFINWIFDGAIMVIHIILHFRMKDVERPLKVPIVAPIIVILFVVYMLISPFLKPVKEEFWYALSFLLAGAVLYFPFVQFKFRLPGVDEFSRCIQKIMNVAPPKEYTPED